MIQKIAITGRMRSGKDTVANYIVERHGHERFSFGDGVLYVVAEYFPEAFAEGKPRKHLQVIGQGFRKLNPDIWITELSHRIKGAEKVVITDLRQQNEYDWLKQQGFTVLKVEAAEAERVARIQAAGDVVEQEMLHHETEESVDGLPFDYLISNNTDLEDLYRQVDWVLAELEREDKE